MLEKVNTPFPFSHDFLLFNYVGITSLLVTIFLSIVQIFHILFPEWHTYKAIPASATISECRKIKNGNRWKYGSNYFIIFLAIAAVIWAWHHYSKMKIEPPKYFTYSSLLDTRGFHKQYWAFKDIDSEVDFCSELICNKLFFNTGSKLFVIDFEETNNAKKVSNKICNGKDADRLDYPLICSPIGIVSEKKENYVVFLTSRDIYILPMGDLGNLRRVKFSDPSKQKIENVGKCFTRGYSLYYFSEFDGEVNLLKLDLDSENITNILKGKSIAFPKSIVGSELNDSQYTDSFISEFCNIYLAVEKRSGDDSKSIKESYIHRISLKEERIDDFSETLPHIEKLLICDGYNIVCKCEDHKPIILDAKNLKHHLGYSLKYLWDNDYFEAYKQLVVLKLNHMMNFTVFDINDDAYFNKEIHTEVARENFFIYSVEDENSNNKARLIYALASNVYICELSNTQSLDVLNIIQNVDVVDKIMFYNRKFTVIYCHDEDHMLYVIDNSRL